MSKAFSELKLDRSVIDTRSYDDGGRMTSAVLGNGITETRAYRTDNLLSSISFSNTNIGNLGYSWDANKNKTAETIGGVMSGYGFTSAGTAYDDEDRLTGYQRAATSGAAVLAQSWALTTVGDWSSVTTNGTAVTRTHGPTHELLTSGGQNVTTDVKGNQTVLPSSLATGGSQLAFTWDYDNKLKSSDIDNNGSADVTYEYDALGRRVARTEGSTAVVYFQADQQTIADYPRGGSASTATYRYVFASYIDEPVVRKTTGTTGTVLYYHRNQQYSILALTDSSGAVSERYAYSAYGQPTFLNASATVQTGSVAGNRYTYTAREWDATLGLHHFRARWISGLTGRFLTRDPIEFKGSEWNLYEYCDSTPMLKMDPDGRIAVGGGWVPWWVNPLNWWTPYNCARDVKDLFDCVTMRRYWNQYGGECENDRQAMGDDFQWMLEGDINCPNQLYPITPRHSLSHARLCCMQKKASAAGLDLKKFANSANACITGMQLPFDAAWAILPISHPVAP